jgi:hypothetical protein
MTDEKINLNEQAKEELKKRYEERVAEKETKKTRGRPRSTETKIEKEVSNVLSEDEAFESLSRLVVMGLDLFNTRIAKYPAPISSIEKQMILTSIPPVLKKYAPNVAESAPEIALVFSLAMVIVPRMVPMIPKSESDKHEEKTT